MRTLALALSTAALALTGTAIAQTAPAQTTGDNAQRAHRVPLVDMTRAQAQTRAETMFAKMDANKDGTLNEADRAARKAQVFDRVDADHNGSVSRAEFDAMHANRGGKMGGRMAHGGMHGEMHKGMRGHHGMMAGPMGKAAAGPMSQQAFVDRALTMFDNADGNHDGTVTVAERKTARDAVRSQWKAKAAARQQG